MRLQMPRYAGLGWVLVLAGILTPMGAQQPPRVPVGGLGVRSGEIFGALHFTVRANYVSPAEVSIPAGVYKIVIDNPQGVVGEISARLEDERAAILLEKPVERRDARTAFYQRLTPGRHRLRIGTKAEWVVTLTVTPPRP